MKKILFLPLLRMQSGHHQTAEALMNMFQKHNEEFSIKKIDLISYTNESLEKIITKSYLKWIRYAPGTYSLVYKKFFYIPPSKEHICKWYQPIFLKKMEQLLAEENPDLIVCTHSFPSYLLSQLKVLGKCHVPIINVYTDFFISNVWGKEGIDLHFLPSKEVKEQLITNHKISKQNLIVTGIPVHEEISKISYKSNHGDRPQILISGGNSGLGNIPKLLNELKKASHYNFLVLCGNNHKLYNEIHSLNVEHIKGLPYVSSRVEMNKLYDQVDAIITKPGGVTVSEALRKRLPIFVNSVLPGQEQINLHLLKSQKLVFELDQNKSLEKQLISTLNNDKKMNRWHQAIESYHKCIEIAEPQKIVEIIENLLDHKRKVIYHA